MPRYPRSPFKKVGASISPKVASDYIETGETKERLTKSATVVVGKTGAVDYLTTDYGSDDACIQATIDYVEGLGGGTILIREGTYTIETTLTIPSDIHIQGTRNTIFVSADSLDTHQIQNSDTVSGNSNICISNIYFDGNLANQSVAAYIIHFDKVFESSVQNCRAYICKGDMVGVTSGSARILIDNCIMDQDTYYAYSMCVISASSYIIFSNNIMYAGEEMLDLNGTVTHCTINANIHYAIENTEQTVDLGVGCDFNVISNNIMYYASNSGVSTDCAISLTDADNNIISGNIIDTCKYGVKIQKSVDGSNYNIVSNNIFTDTGKTAIWNKADNNNTILESNIINTTGEHAILIDGLSENITISNNNITSAGYTGIYFANVVNGNVSNNTVKNSSLQAAGHSGIRLLGGTGVSYSIISGNICYDDQGTKTQIYGIREEGSSDYNIIETNHVTRNLTGTITKVGNNTIVQNNYNYNPVGSVGPPSVPATTVNYTNAYGYPCQVQVYGGTVTEIDIDDIATGLTSGIFIIPPGGTINITYSAAPSWRWWGL